MRRRPRLGLPRLPRRPRRPALAVASKAAAGRAGGVVAAPVRWHRRARRPWCRSCSLPRGRLPAPRHRHVLRAAEAVSHFAAHSMRSGGASEAARRGLPPHEICHLAGVKDISWLLYYMRQQPADRLRASWSIGLCALPHLGCGGAPAAPQAAGHASRGAGTLRIWAAGGRGPRDHGRRPCRPQCRRRPASQRRRAPGEVPWAAGHWSWGWCVFGDRGRAKSRRAGAAPRRICHPNYLFSLSTAPLPPPAHGVSGTCKCKVHRSFQCKREHPRALHYECVDR